MSFNWTSAISVRNMILRVGIVLALVLSAFSASAETYSYTFSFWPATDGAITLEADSITYTTDVLLTGDAASDDLLANLTLASGETLNGAALGYFALFEAADDIWHLSTPIPAGPVEGAVGEVLGFHMQFISDVSPVLGMYMTLSAGRYVGDNSWMGSHYVPSLATLTISYVPLPAAAWLLLSGLGSLGFAIHRRRAP